ncbi:MAG: hypothetical protein WCW64_11140 [Phycisphaerae bacterium]|jgi:hypothetical protein
MKLIQVSTLQGYEETSYGGQDGGGYFTLDSRFGSMMLTTGRWNDKSYLVLG